MEPVPRLQQIFNSPKLEIEFEGKTYLFHEPTQVEEGQFCAWLANEAVASLQRMQHLTESQRAEQIQTLNDRIAAGDFDWGSAATIKAMGTLKGVTKMTQIQLQPVHPEVDLRFAERMVRAKVREIMEALAGEAATDPTVRAALMKLGWTFGGSSTSGSPASSTRPSEDPATSTPSGK